MPLAYTTKLFENFHVFQNNYKKWNWQWQGAILQLDGASVTIKIIYKHYITAIYTMRVIKSGNDYCQPFCVPFYFYQNTQQSHYGQETIIVSFDNT